MIEQVVADEAGCIAATLRNHGAISDPDFDRLFPPAQRLRSDWHWTPIDVALRVATLLDAQPGHSILDVGAGVGKLCLVGALATGASWFGVEHDAEMVQVARDAAIRLGVADRARFLRCDVSAVSWNAFDGIYLFNPFGERRFKGDSDPELQRRHYLAEVARARACLTSARAGAHVVTYHGFGRG